MTFLSIDNRIRAGNSSITVPLTVSGAGGNTEVNTMASVSTPSKRVDSAITVRTSRPGSTPTATSSCTVNVSLSWGAKSTAVWDSVTVSPSDDVAASANESCVLPRFTSTNS